MMFGSSLEAQQPLGQGPVLQAFLFGDAIYGVSDGVGPEGFELGQIVAHGNAILSNHVVFLGEASISARSTGYVLTMERAVLRYEFSDPLKISAGRYHTPISYWNTEFHHGLWLQGSVARPEAVKFGSRYIPVHFVGAMVEGNLNAVPLFYSIGVGNGRGENIAAAGDAGDVNGNRAVLFSASVRPRNLFGFRVGGALYVDRIADAGVDVADERIASGHVVWKRSGAEFSAEVIVVTHTSRMVDESTSSPSFYVHLGHRLRGALRDFTPYARYENIDIATGDIVFGGVLDDYEAFVAGLRFDFDQLAALKAEYRGETVGAGARANAFFLQASFAIPVSGGS
jgi:hypothetical protein